MKILVTYQSKHGRTANYGRQIAMYLWQRGADVTFVSMAEVEPAQLHTYDMVFWGTWTAGLFVVGQHPPKLWRERIALFAPLYHGPSVLYATYKYRTGSIFSKMYRLLGVNPALRLPTLQSKVAILSDADKALLDSLVARTSARH